ncbi:TfoX/Sxy family protein, partial [Polymorphobacter multimanifer]
MHVVRSPRVCVASIDRKTARRSVEHDPKALQAAMEAARPHDLELAFRPMFGGVFGYAAGQAFASLSNMGLALKMTGADHAALSEVADVKPLRYQPDDPPSKTYLLLPNAILSDAGSLRSWIARSAAGLKPKTGKTRKKPVEGK